MPEITIKQIAKELAPYGVECSDALCRKIITYIQLLLRWNKATSLTTVTDPHEIVKFHFGESIFAATKVPIQNGRLADVGSGAGFPGIPLSLAVTALDVTLIEANTKKCAFLAEAIREIGGNDIKARQGAPSQPDVHCRVFHGRMEEFPKEEKFNFVTVRAVGDVPSVLDWASGHLTDEGRVVLWLAEAAIDGVRRDSSWIWQDPEKIPGSERRFLLVGEWNKR